jgi:hypothetical protein
MNRWYYLKPYMLNYTERQHIKHLNSIAGTRENKRGLLPTPGQRVAVDEPAAPTHSGGTTTSTSSVRGGKYE